MSHKHSSSDSATTKNRVWWFVMPVFYTITIPLWIGFCLSSHLFLNLTATDFLVFVLLVHYCASLGTWVGLGSVWWRWFVIAIASPLIGVIAGFSAGREQLEFQVFCLSIISIVGSTAMWLRIRKGNLQIVTEQVDSPNALSFGIKDIFLWTTAAALFLGVGGIVRQFVDWEEVAPERFYLFFSITGLALIISIPIVVNVWVMLGKQFSITKGVAMATISICAMIACCFWIPRGYFFALVTLLAQLLMLFTLFVLRRQGWRFVKTKRVSQRSTSVFTE